MNLKVSHKRFKIARIWPGETLTGKRLDIDLGGREKDFRQVKVELGCVVTSIGDSQARWDDKMKYLASHTK
jgi:hypothetical protein